jgi:hypothetical protein
MAVSGCGSDSSTGSDSSDEPVALSKPQFVKQANEICSEGLKEKDKAVASSLKELSASGGSPKPKELEKAIEESVFPSYRKLIDSLGELGAPKGDEAQVEKMIAEYEAAMQSAEAEPAKAIKQNMFASADKNAEGYGLKNCRL